MSFVHKCYMIILPDSALKEDNSYKSTNKNFGLSAIPKILLDLYNIDMIFFALNYTLCKVENCDTFTFDAEMRKDQLFQVPNSNQYFNLMCVGFRPEMLPLFLLYYSKLIACQFRCLSTFNTPTQKFYIINLYVKDSDGTLQFSRTKSLKRVSVTRRTRV